MTTRCRIALAHYTERDEASRAREALISQGIDSRHIMFELGDDFSSLRVALPQEQEKGVVSFLLATNATRVDVHDVH